MTRFDFTTATATGSDWIAEAIGRYDAARDAYDSTPADFIHDSMRVGHQRQMAIAAASIAAAMLAREEQEEQIAMANKDVNDTPKDPRGDKDNRGGGNAGSKGSGSNSADKNYGGGKANR
jgi:hypothetical protein